RDGAHLDQARGRDLGAPDRLIRPHAQRSPKGAGLRERVRPFRWVPRRTNLAATAFEATSGRIVMSLPPTFLAIRALAALLLAVIGLQAVPVQAVGIERHHGSAFDISAVDVATAPALRMASGGEVQRL